MHPRLSRLLEHVLSAERKQAVAAQIAEELGAEAAQHVSRPRGDTGKESRCRVGVVLARICCHAMGSNTGRQAYIDSHCKLFRLARVE